MNNLQKFRADFLFSKFITHSSVRDIYTLLAFSLKSSLLYLLFLFFIFIFLILLKHIIIFLRDIYEKKVFIVLTPPFTADKSADTTNQFFSVVHQIGLQTSLIDKLLGRKSNFSFEIAASSNKGIRYIIGASPERAKVIERLMYSYLQGVIIERVDEYLPDNFPHTEVVEFKLDKHFAFPLVKQSILDGHDAVSYITGMMTKLKKDDAVVFQILLSSAQPAEARKISNMIMRNDNVLEYLQNSNVSGVHLFVGKVFLLPVYILKALLDILSSILTEFVHGSNVPEYNHYSNYENGVRSNRVKPIRELSTFEQNILQPIQDKLNQPLFEASIRLLVKSDNKNQRKVRFNSIQSTLAQFSHPLFQSFIAKRNFPIISTLRVASFKKRIFTFPSFTAKSLFSVSEIADLYHFPSSKTIKTEDVQRTKFKTLAAPLSVKNEIDEKSITLGKNIYTGSETLIKISKKQRKEHMYVVGGSGMGKTTLLTSMIYQDIIQGKGLCVIDPHGDLTKDMLSFIPKNRQRDVVYINPGDIEYAVGLNILAPFGINLSLEENKERITSALITIFQKLTEEGYWGPRLEHILRNAVLTSYESHSPTEIPTLYTLQLLLSDRGYRKKISQKLHDPILRNFWEKEFNLYGSMQLANVISPITNKLGKFITNKLARRILLQEKTTLDIPTIMNEGKILLVNLSKGEIGNDRSFFFGSIITSLIQLAAYERTLIPEKNRKDFYLYIDEFQNFATASFAELVSESRKYHIYTILAHQNTAQLASKDLLKVILGNVGTLFSFRTSPDDEAVLIPFFSPEVKKGDLVNLKPHQFILKMRNERLEDSFTGETIVLKEKRSKQGKEEIVHENRVKYAKSITQIDKELENLFSINNDKSYKTSYFQLGKHERKVNKK